MLIIRINLYWIKSIWDRIILNHQKRHIKNYINKYEQYNFNKFESLYKLYIFEFIELYFNSNKIDTSLS